MNDTVNTANIELRIRSYCKVLRLSPDFAERAIGYEGKAGNLEFLRWLLEKEVERRMARKFDRLSAKAGLPCRYAPSQFDDTEVDFPPGESYRSILDLPFCKEKAKKNVVMLGGSGTGKSMLSSILGTEICNAGMEVRYFRTEDLVRCLEETEAASFAESLGKTQAIILDDFASVPYSLDGARRLLSLISRINGKVSIILNTSLEFARWPEVLGDKTVASSFAGRILQDSYLLLFRGHDRRFDGYRSRVSG